VRGVIAAWYTKQFAGFRPHSYRQISLTKTYVGRSIEQMGHMRRGKGKQDEEQYFISPPPTPLEGGGVAALRVTMDSAPRRESIGQARGQKEVRAKSVSRGGEPAATFSSDEEKG